MQRNKHKSKVSYDLENLKPDPLQFEKKFYKLQHPLFFSVLRATIIPLLIVLAFSIFASIYLVHSPLYFETPPTLEAINDVILLTNQSRAFFHEYKQTPWLISNQHKWNTASISNLPNLEKLLEYTPLTHVLWSLKNSLQDKTNADLQPDICISIVTSPRANNNILYLLPLLRQALPSVVKDEKTIIKVIASSGVQPYSKSWIEDLKLVLPFVSDVIYHGSLLLDEEVGTPKDILSNTSQPNFMHGRATFDEVPTYVKEGNDYSLALDACLAEKAEYILVLEDDVEPTVSFVQKLRIMLSHIAAYRADGERKDAQSRLRGERKLPNEWYVKLFFSDAIVGWSIDWSSLWLLPIGSVISISFLLISVMLMKKSELKHRPTLSAVIMGSMALGILLSFIAGKQHVFRLLGMDLIPNGITIAQWGSRYRLYEIHDPCCTPAQLYSAAAAKELAELLIGRENPEPKDLFLSFHGQENQWKVFLLLPTPFEHIGKISALRATSPLHSIEYDSPNSNQNTRILD